MGEGPRFAHCGWCTCQCRRQRHVHVLRLPAAFPGCVHSASERHSEGASRFQRPPCGNRYCPLLPRLQTTHHPNAIAHRSSVPRLPGSCTASSASSRRSARGRAEPRPACSCRCCFCFCAGWPAFMPARLWPLAPVDRASPNAARSCGTLMGPLPARSSSTITSSAGIFSSPDIFRATALLTRKVRAGKSAGGSGEAAPGCSRSEATARSAPDTASAARRAEGGQQTIGQAHEPLLRHGRHVGPGAINAFQ
jgi:hypothetical protein